MPKVIGKVRRAYLIDINPFHRDLVRRVLINELGLVFIPSYAWTTINRNDYKIIELPGEIDYHDWWDGWWTNNWKYSDWSWCYIRRQPKFTHCVIHGGATFMG